ncbi:MAG: hypothetical protein ACI9C2_002130, partial [Gammaproteobacteria bacterium]
AAGFTHAVALDSTGTIQAWGSDASGEVSGAPAGSGFLDVASGEFFSVAIRADGSLAFWGGDTFGQLSAIPTGSSFVEVSAGGSYAVARRADGSLAAWGYDDFGVVTKTPTTTGFVQLASGRFHSLALRADGSIVAWGPDGTDGGVFGEQSPVIETPVTADFTSIACGDFASYGTRNPDCNGNSIPDYTDIATGTSSDCNANGLPDSCELATGVYVDIDGNGVLDDCSTPRLQADKYELYINASGSQSTAGKQVLTLTPGPGHFFDTYLLIGSVSGTSPGIPLGALNLPLQPDFYLDFTLLHPNTPPLTKSMGLLLTGVPVDATFTLPPNLGPSFIGLVIHHAYVSYNPATATIIEVSNAVPATLFP